VTPVAPDAEPSEPEADGEPGELVAGGHGELVADEPGELVAEPTEPTPGQVILVQSRRRLLRLTKFISTGEER
jgi:hypothetical protein